MFTDRRAASLASRRERQPWPKDKVFKILSLDGGGIKGIYSAQFLARCEEELAAGRPLSSYFDMIAGTSTGGIIALGLAMGYSTSEILDFYIKDGRKIFPPLPSTRIGRWRRFLSWLFRPHLDHAELEKALKRRLGNRPLGEASTRVVIPAFMVPKTEIAVFKTDHHSDFKNDYKTPAWEVARSTSAAPTYLKGHEHEPSGRIFIDGGVWANNPVMVALVDVLSAYDISPEQIDILSIGTGNPPFELRARAATGGAISWREAIKAAMFLTTDNATAQAKLLLGPDRCLRFEPGGDTGTIEMDDYDRAIPALPPLADTHFNVSRDLVARFFAEVVLPRERHFSQ
ncbi:CBASS cGAMP-activated phospholipase [Erythrobacter sp. MTPC3]|uniref:CBASS cGAMP-activated phospholipase n=1 Tax=Erythrobacter sp. MTPC3 TaxID=3056564 RepID=UPI0036F1B2CF